MPLKPLEYDAHEYFMAANGVGFSAKEVVRNLLKKADGCTSLVTQENVDTELASIRLKTVQQCNVYARDTLSINTGNRFCS